MDDSRGCCKFDSRYSGPVICVVCRDHEHGASSDEVCGTIVVVIYMSDVSGCS